MRQLFKRLLSLGVALAMTVLAVPAGVYAMPVTQQNGDTQTVEVNLVPDGERSATFNENWKFIQDDPENAQSPDYNDSYWETVNLPHDFSIDGEFTTQGEAESGFLLGGTGWYRKTFSVPLRYEVQNKKIFLDFDGVYSDAYVYVNGTYVGEHHYGYTPFGFDITSYLNYGPQEENVIAVKVVNNIPTSRWYSGSGIYRDVTLTITDPVHIADGSTAITTPNLGTEVGGTVNVSVTSDIKNESTEDKNVTVKATVLDSDGNNVGNATSTQQTVSAGGTVTFIETPQVTSPTLWSTDDPNLYQVKQEVSVDSTVVDTVTTDYGFRYFDFNAKTGFSLNGTNMKLQGVCMHHDQGALGSVSNEDAIERQVKTLKDMGVNAIRVTHNPASQQLLDVCNRNGILVIDEAFDTWLNPKNGNTNDYSKWFDVKIEDDNQILKDDMVTGERTATSSTYTWAQYDARAMVKSARNDPCVIMWSLGNEVWGASGSFNEYPAVARDIIKWIQAEDKTRPVTSGDNEVMNGNEKAIEVCGIIADAGGVVGMNYANATEWEKVRDAHSDWKMYGSETSSAIHSRGYYKTDGQSFEDLQMSAYDNNKARVSWGDSASQAWNDTITRDDNAGEFIWTGFDYIGEPTPWNGTSSGSVSGRGAMPNSSYFGAIDTAGFPKDIYYFYRSQWQDDKTTLDLVPASWNQDDLNIDSNGKVRVDVFTNAPYIELYLDNNDGNGPQKIGSATRTENTTTSDYKYYTYTASGDSAVTKEGAYTLYPSFDVTYAEGTLSVKAFDSAPVSVQVTGVATEPQPQTLSTESLVGAEITDTVGVNSVSTTKGASKLQLTAEQTSIEANGTDLAYIDVQLQDEDGKDVNSASNEITFQLSGPGKIVGVDNGNAATTESYKPTSDTKATRSAFSGKALVIVQSEKGQTGDITLTASCDGMQEQVVTVNTTAMSDDNKYLQSYDIVRDYYLAEGETPQLPDKVLGRFSDGSTQEISVGNWWYDEDKIQSHGNYRAMARFEVDEQEYYALVNLRVLGTIVALENYATFTYAEETPTLPQVLPAYLEDGSTCESGPFAVTWDFSGCDFSTPGTVVEVPGSAKILDTTYNLTASVRVTNKRPVSQNIAINDRTNTDVPELSQTCNPTSDNLSSIINGTTNNGTNTNERWTNYSDTSGTNPCITMTWDNSYTIDEVDLWEFTDSNCDFPDSVTFSYLDSTDNTYKEIGHVDAKINEQSYQSGFTPYLLNEPVTTSSLKITLTPKTDKCVGLTEVAVKTHIEYEQPQTDATLSGITLDGQPLAGFSPAQTTYTVSRDALPTEVTATPTAHAAVTVLPIYNNASKMMVYAEDGTQQQYEVDYQLPSNPTDGGETGGDGSGGTGTDGANGSDASASASASGSVKTGDTSSLLSASALLAGAATTGLLLRKKRRRKK